MLNKYFPKKFKVRVRLYETVASTEKCYCIEYSNSRFSDKWIAIKDWSSVDVKYDIEFNLVLLQTFDDAVTMAESFRIIENINHYNRLLSEKRNTWLQERKEYLTQHQPMIIKNISGDFK